MIPWTTAMTTLALTLGQPPSDAATTQPAGPQEQADRGGLATGFLYQTLELDGESYAYCVFVPPTYTPDRDWPVVLFLHGSGERGRDGFLQTDVGIGTAIRRHPEFFQALVVMPQCRPGESWTGEMARMALKCVERTSLQYRLDGDRIYLTGLSLGGHGTWIIGAELAERFAALVPICGFVELEESTGLARKVAARLTDIPIWCFHGAQDRSVPVEKSRELVQAIRDLGGTVKYTEYEHGGHTVWTRAYRSQRLWDWVFAQRRGQPMVDE